MWIATFNYALLCLGFSQRKRRLALHQKLMAAGILLDVGLVLILQFQREAIQTAASLTLEPLQQVHVYTSLAATILYLPLLYWGVSMVRQPSCRPQLRHRHRQVGYAAFALRSLGFVFMFSLMS